MSNSSLRPFLLGTEKTKMTGLWDSDCFRKVQRSSLPKGLRVFGSRFHYKIKCYNTSNTLQKLKVRLVIQRNRMEEGTDYEQSFTP
eukprot:2215811-Rhodomonas_salina.2